MLSASDTGSSASCHELTAHRQKVKRAVVWTKPTEWRVHRLDLGERLPTKRCLGHCCERQHADVVRVWRLGRHHQGHWHGRDDRDLVLTQDEVNPVMSALLDNALEAATC